MNKAEKKKELNAKPNIYARSRPKARVMIIILKNTSLKEISSLLKNFLTIIKSRNILIVAQWRIE